MAENGRDWGRRVALPATPRSGGTPGGAAPSRPAAVAISSRIGLMRCRDQAERSALQSCTATVTSGGPMFLLAPKQLRPKRQLGHPALSCAAIVRLSSRLMISSVVPVAGNRWTWLPLITSNVDGSQSPTREPPEVSMRELRSFAGGQQVFRAVRIQSTCGRNPRVGFRF